MSVGKGYTRPEFWPPVGSIVQTQGSMFVPDGSWVVIHLTNGVVYDHDGNYRMKLSALHAGDKPLYRVFRRGRNDYSEAWHQTLPWMEDAR